MKANVEPPKIQTTLRLPRDLYEKVNRFVASSASRVDSMNDFFVRAVRAYIEMLRRRQVDAEFAAMASDAAYQEQAKAIAEEFSASDWEALEMAEREADGVRNAAR